MFLLILTSFSPHQVDELRITAEEEADFETKDIRVELKAFAAMADFSEEDMPDEAQLSVLDQYSSSAEDYLQVGGLPCCEYLSISFHRSQVAWPCLTPIN